MLTKDQKQIMKANNLKLHKKIIYYFEDDKTTYPGFEYSDIDYALEDAVKLKKEIDEVD